MIRSWARLLSFLTALPLLAFAEPSRDLDAYLNASFLAEGKLADFDRELDKGKLQPEFLRRSQTYRELLAIRILREKLAHSITQRISQLREGEHDYDTFVARIQSLDPAERLEATDLLPELRRTIRGAPVFYSSLQEELAARTAAAALLASRVAEARQNQKLLAEVKALLPSLDLGSKENLGPAKVQPGAGAEGTLDGSSFPANTWALTFDDGPHPKYSPMIMEQLEGFRKKASFLWLVECLEQAPELVGKARALGFPTNNHSWTHENLDKAKPEVLNREIANSTERETQIYGEKPRFFRLPYGAGLSNKSVRELIAHNGMIHVFWNVDSLDWKDKNPDSILDRIKKQMSAEKKGIILLHDIHPQSVEATKLLLKFSASLDHSPKALRWVTIPEIVDELNRKKERLIEREKIKRQE